MVAEMIYHPFAAQLGQHIKGVPNTFNMKLVEARRVD
jgi:hypothetical protein